jgi:signal transduction histidine kinase
MSILVLLLIGTLGVIYYTSYMDVYRRDQNMLERYLNGDFRKGIEDGEKDPKGDRRFKDENFFFLAVFYSVILSDTGEAIAVDNSDRSIYSEEKLTKLAKTLAEKGKTQGTAESLIYRIKTEEGATIVAFMDNTIMRESITTLFQYTLIFGGVTIVLLFFLSMSLAKKIVQPLEESYQKQKQFISDAGHELKTPVAVIETNAELLSREIGDNQWLSNIQFENHRMAVLTKQLMELVKTENVKLHMQTLDFSRIVLGELLTFESIAFEKGVELYYDAIPEAISVCGNAEQLGRLISILLDNAIEHSPKTGKIVADLKTRHHRAVFSIRNRGEAISKKEQELIFERFYRSDFSRTGEDNHYGLGLAIAKSIVEMHRGKIQVSCEHGWIVFLVSIPLEY